MEQKKYTALEKLTILQEIERGDIGLKAAARKYGLSKTSVVKWRQRYQLYGYEGLEVRSHNRTYSAELKLHAVKDYLEGGLSQNQIICKHKIASSTQLANWIRKYNGHSNSLTAHSGGNKAMTK
ncbi:transposase [Paenibacillus sp. FSL K6-2859]|uniref:transposase n=1 Tax=Paenibacillus sp. FSL K6-2859 TaxID=2921482 RepID=UPI0030F96E66